MLDELLQSVKYVQAKSRKTFDKPRVKKKFNNNHELKYFCSKLLILSRDSGIYCFTEKLNKCICLHMLFFRQVHFACIYFTAELNHLLCLRHSLALNTIYCIFKVLLKKLLCYFKFHRTFPNYLFTNLLISDSLCSYKAMLLKRFYNHFNGQKTTYQIILGIRISSILHIHYL